MPPAFTGCLAEPDVHCLTFKNAPRIRGSSIVAEERMKHESFLFVNDILGSEVFQYEIVANQ